MKRSTEGLRCYRDAVAIVTGGASGIGRAIGTELARRGAEVVLADRQAALATDAAAAIVADGGRAAAAELDVRDPEAFAALASRTAERTGRIDFLFNNAGIGIFGSAASHRLEDWKDTVEVNLLGVMYGIHAVYPTMRRQGFGRIVNTASVAGLAPVPILSSYAATKHAVVGLSLSLRAEAARHGVGVTALCPGVVRTPILLGGTFGRNRSGLDETGASPFWERLGPIDAATLARAALDRIAKNPAILVLPRHARFLPFLARHFPALYLSMATREYARMADRNPTIDPTIDPTRAEGPTPSGNDKDSQAKTS